MFLPPRNPSVHPQARALYHFESLAFTMNDLAGSTTPRHSPNPTPPRGGPHQAVNTTSSLSCKNVRLGKCLRCSMSEHREVASSPDNVPVPIRSPVRMRHPESVWKASICRNVQYEFLKHDLVIPISLSSDPPGIIFMLTEISYVASPSSTRYDGTLRMSCAILNGSSASRVTTHGLIVLAKFFALNAPKGRVSGICISRALQSFSNTTPNICSSVFSTGTRSKCSVGTLMKKASSSSKSSSFVGASENPVVRASVLDSMGVSDGRSSGALSSRGPEYDLFGDARAGR